MTLVRALGGWHTEDSRYVRVAGAWRRVTGISVFVSGAWRTADGYTPPFSASAPSEVEGSQYTGKPTTVQVSTSAAITINGGRSPYSYSWTRIGGDSRIQAQSPSMSSTQITARLQAETASATFAWSATDATGQTANGQTVATLTALSDF